MVGSCFWDKVDKATARNINTPDGHWLVFHTLHFQISSPQMHLGKQWHLDQVLGLLHPHGRLWGSSCLLVLVWPSSSHYCHLGSKLVDGRPLSFLSPPTLGIFKKKINPMGLPALDWSSSSCRDHLESETEGKRSLTVSLLSLITLSSKSKQKPDQISILGSAQIR